MGGGGGGGGGAPVTHGLHLCGAMRLTSWPFQSKALQHCNHPYSQADHVWRKNLGHVEGAASSIGPLQVLRKLATVSRGKTLDMGYIQVRSEKGLLE